MAFPSGTLIDTPQGGLEPIETRGLKAGFSGHVRRVVLKNGLRLHVDGEQPLWVARGTSTPARVRARELRRGDRLLMPYRRYDPPLALQTLCVGEDFGEWAPSEALVNDPALWHMLGYALGDGYFPGPKVEDAFRLFLYDRRDAPLLPTFLALCGRHGIDAAVGEGDHPMLTLYHVPFSRWLRALGFRSLHEGERFVPARLMAAPAWMREAMVAGLFACWGQWYEKDSEDRYAEHFTKPHIPVGTDRIYGHSILQLLWSVGIAATLHHGQGAVRIRDRGRFQDRVAILCPHKAPEHFYKPVPERAERWDSLAHETTVHLAVQLRERPGWKGVHCDEREKILRHRYGGTGIRRREALRLCREVGMKPPWWLDFHHAAIGSTELLEDRTLFYSLPDDARTASFCLVTRGE